MAIYCRKCGEKNDDTAHYCCKCRGEVIPFSRSGSLKKGTVLEGRYEIIKRTNKGGMGAIYKARDTKLDYICAVKELLDSGGTPEEQKKSAERFKNEAKLLARLDHPNLPRVSDYFVSHDRYYLVMNFIEGEDLESILKKEGKPGLPEHLVIKWAVEVLKVLIYLHSHNPPVIYRDIKPSNIMVHKDGRIILIDFGIARIIYPDGGTQTTVGTDGYAPEEQYYGKVEPASDLYALGATMHHLLTGVTPLPFKFDPPVTIVPSLSPEVESVVMKALREKPKDRFSSAEEMLLALDFNKTKDITPPVIKYIPSGIWKLQESNTSVKLNSVYFIDSKRGWVAGDEGTLLYTEDGGEKWIKKDIATSANLKKILFFDEKTGWAAGAGKLWGGVILHTRDGGETWRQENKGPLYSFDFADREHGWAVGGNGLILYTKDGGNTWHEQKSGTCADLIDVHFVDLLSGIAAGGGVITRGTIVYTMDGGEKWIKSDNTPPTRIFRGVQIVDHKTAWIVGDFALNYGIIIISTDKGNTWREKKTNAVINDVFFLDSGYGLVCGDKGTILFTPDGGDNWIKQDSDVKSSLNRIYFSDPQNGWIVGDKGIILKYRAG